MCADRRYALVNQQRTCQWPVQGTPNLLRDLDVLAAHAESQRDWTAAEENEWKTNVVHLLSVYWILQHMPSVHGGATASTIVGGMGPVEKPGVKRPTKAVLRRERRELRAEQRQRQEKLESEPPRQRVEEEEKKPSGLTFTVPWNPRGAVVAAPGSTRPMTAMVPAASAAAGLVLAEPVQRQIMAHRTMLTLTSPFLSGLEFVTIHQTGRDLHRAIVELRNSRQYLVNDLDMDKVFFRDPVTNQTMTVRLAADVFCGRAAWEGQEWERTMLDPAHYGYKVPPAVAADQRPKIEQFYYLFPHARKLRLGQMWKDPNGLQYQQDLGWQKLEAWRDERDKTAGTAPFRTPREVMVPEMLQMAAVGLIQPRTCEQWDLDNASLVESMVQNPQWLELIRREPADAIPTPTEELAALLEFQPDVVRRSILNRIRNLCFPKPTDVVPRLSWTEAKPVLDAQEGDDEDTADWLFSQPLTASTLSRLLVILARVGPSDWKGLTPAELERGARVQPPTLARQFLSRFVLDKLAAAGVDVLELSVDHGKPVAYPGRDVNQSWDCRGLLRVLVDEGLFNDLIPDTVADMNGIVAENHRSWDWAVDLERVRDSARQDHAMARRFVPRALWSAEESKRKESDKVNPVLVKWARQSERELFLLRVAKRFFVPLRSNATSCVSGLTDWACVRKSLALNLDMDLIRQWSYLKTKVHPWGFDPMDLLRKSPDVAEQDLPQIFSDRWDPNDPRREPDYEWLDLSTALVIVRYLVPTWVPSVPALFREHAKDTKNLVLSTLVEFASAPARLETAVTRLVAVSGAPRPRVLAWLACLPWIVTQLFFVVEARSTEQLRLLLQVCPLPRVWTDLFSQEQTSRNGAVVKSFMNLLSKGFDRTAQAVAFSVRARDWILQRIEGTIYEYRDAFLLLTKNENASVPWDFGRELDLVVAIHDHGIIELYERLSGQKLTKSVGRMILEEANWMWEEEKTTPLDREFIFEADLATRLLRGTSAKDDILTELPRADETARRQWAERSVEEREAFAQRVLAFVGAH